MFSVWWVLATQSASPDDQEKLEFGPETILVYENVALSNDEVSQFVLRIARFQPDIVFEWESESHQGTVHLFSEAVEEGERWTTSSLFESGVDLQSEDTLIKWISRDTYRDLVDKGRAEIKANRLPIKLKLEGRGAARILVNGQEMTVPVLEVSDSRGGVWRIHDDLTNPALIEYSTRFYRESLKRVATDQEGSLRWIPRLPPVQ